VKNIRNTSAFEIQNTSESVRQPLCVSVNGRKFCDVNSVINLTKKDETFLRINFKYPGGPVVAGQEPRELS